MRILDSAIEFSTRHAKVERHEVRESLRVTVGVPPPPPAIDTVTVSPEAVTRAGEATLDDEDAATPLEPALEMLRLIVERMFGEKIKVFVPPNGEGAATAAGKAAAGAPPQPPAQRRGPGIEVAYDRSESRMEAEHTRMQAEGVVRTADGKEIAFSLSMELARARVETSETRIRLSNGVPVDPLVINFDGLAAQLTTDRIAFDIDSDGDPEQMAGLASGSGWLALDRNGDGRITSGGELFGPTTGNGYAELAVEDGDGSGWIDEGDTVFARLLVVTGQAADGTLATRSLASTNVGAIGLDTVQTPFTYTDLAGQTLGVSRAAGVFVAEDGRVGTTQQVDVVV